MFDRPHIRRCPICETELPPSLRSIFCSDRCRRIDLSRWLSEEYRIKAGEAGDEGSLVRSTETAGDQHESGGDHDD